MSDHLTSNGRTVEREEFLADIFHTAVEGGITDWADVIEYHWNDLAAEDYTAVIVDKEWNYDEDPDSEPDFPKTVINTNEIQRGIDVIKSWKETRDFEPNYLGDGGAYWRQFLLADETNGEDGDYDAIVADWIVQAGLFGQIIYG